MSDSNLKAVGEKTHITLKTAVIVVVLAVVPLTIFIKGMSDDVGTIKKWMESTEARQNKITDDHEARIRILESAKKTRGDF